MIAAEFKRALREGAILLCILFLLATAILISDKKDLLAPALEVFLLLYASFMGWAIFNRERQDGAMEYLLSLPISRTKLLLIKLLPRFICVAAVFLLYLLAHRAFSYPTILQPWIFLIFYAAFFTSTFSFSLSLMNYVNALLLTTALSIGLTYLISTLNPAIPEWCIYLQGNFLLFILPFILFAHFNRFDVRPLASFNRRFLPFCALLLVITIGYLLLRFGTRYFCHALTANGDMVRVTCQTCDHTEWLGRDGTVRRYSGCLHPLQEKEGKMYVEYDPPGHAGPKEIVRINFASGEKESLCRVPDNWFIIKEAMGKAGIILADRFFLLLGNEKLKQLQILEVTATQMRTIPVQIPISRKHDYNLVHVTDANKFFILSDSQLFCIDSSGKAQLVCQAKAVSAWKDRLLVFTNEAMILYRIGQSLEPLFRMEGIVRKCRRKFSSSQQRVTLFKAQGQTYLFDLEKESPEKITAELHPYDYFEKGNRLLVIEADAEGDITILELKDKHVSKRTSWHTTINGGRIVVYPAGILVNDLQSNRFEVFYFN